MNENKGGVPGFPGEDDEYWTVSDIMDRWNCSRVTVYRATSIPYMQTSPRAERRYRKSDVLAFEEERMVGV